MHFSQIDQGREIAQTFRPESRIRPDQDNLGVGDADDHLSDKLGGAEGTEFAIEGQLQHGVHTGLGEKLGLLGVTGEAFRTTLGAEQTQGVAVEGDDGTYQRTLTRHGSQRVDDVPMTAMKPIELAEGDHARAEICRYLGEGGVKEHRQCCAFAAASGCD